ncbi:MAG TPA: branched-chain amino acid ABC transporter substrate-binding protein, partial [Pseudomonas sp.]
MRPLLPCLFTALGLLAAGPASAELEVRIGYLGYTPDRGPVLSNVIPEPTDAGRRGAELAIEDSNSTGRFLKHSYRLESAEAASGEALLEQARALHDGGLRLFVVNAPADTLRQLAGALPDSLLLNAGSADDSLR